MTVFGKGLLNQNIPQRDWGIKLQSQSGMLKRSFYLLLRMPVQGPSFPDNMGVLVRLQKKNSTAKVHPKYVKCRGV